MNDFSLSYAPTVERCDDVCSKVSANSVVATNLLERTEVVTLLPAEQKELGRYVVGTDPMELTTECEPLDLGGYLYAKR